MTLTDDIDEERDTCTNCGGGIHHRQGIWLHSGTGETACYDEGDPLHRTAEPDA